MYSETDNLCITLELLQISPEPTKSRLPTSKHTRSRASPKTPPRPRRPQPLYPSHVKQQRSSSRARKSLGKNGTGKTPPKSAERRPPRWPALAKIVRAINGPSEVDGYESPESSDESDGDSDKSIPTTDTSTTNPTENTVNRHPPNFQPHRPENPQRHAYPHRGHSKSSLLHQKSFWHERYEEWVAWHAQFDYNHAYGGVAYFQVDDASESGCHSMHGPPRHSTPIARASCDTPDLTRELNPAIFPRVGDLSSLRDVQSVKADKTLSKFPLWTLSKMAWSFDADHRTRVPRTLEFLSGLSPTCRTVTGASDRHLDDKEQNTDDSDSDYSLLSASSVNDSLSSASSFGDVSSSNTKTVQISLDNEPHTCASDLMQALANANPQRPWEHSWTARWEILLSQVKLSDDGNNFQEVPSEHILLSMPPSGLLGPGWTEKTPHKVRLPQEPSRHAFPIVEEEDDYGEIVANPIFRLGASLSPYLMFAEVDQAEKSVLSSQDGTTYLEQYPLNSGNSRQPAEPTPKPNQKPYRQLNFTAQFERPSTELANGPEISETQGYPHCNVLQSISDRHLPIYDLCLNHNDVNYLTVIQSSSCALPAHPSTSVLVRSRGAPLDYLL